MFSHPGLPAVALALVPSPSADGRTSVASYMPGVVQLVPLAAWFQVTCISCQFFRTRAALNTDAGPQSSHSDNVADNIVAPFGTGPPSDAKIAKRISSDVLLGVMRS